MILFNFLKKKYVASIMKKDPRFAISKEKQIKIINDLNSLRDLIERSYYQFLSQKRMLGIKSFFLNLFSFFLIPFKLISYKPKHLHLEECDLICFLSGIDKTLVPEDLINKYEHVEFCLYNGEESFNKIARKWFFKNIVKKHPFSFFYQLKVLSRLRIYTFLVEKYHPIAIANHFEYSCASSAMTKFCHDMGVKHINFMHGEKIWYIRDSFFEFDECYVWNEHYSKLFIELKACKTQFIVSVPPSFLLKPNDYSITRSIEMCDYCYYLANETHDQINVIIAELKKLINKGLRCRLRIHPRWGDHNYIQKVAKENGVEVEQMGINIYESIMSTKNAISLFSTVLFQSYLVGKRIVIDDISQAQNA